MTEQAGIGKDQVVQFHYTITNPAGSVLETTSGGAPQAILLGHGGVLRGIEDALKGRQVGDTIEVSLPPAEAYGERRADWVQRVSKKHLPKGRLKPGMIVQLSTEQGPRSVTIVKVGNKVVDVDLNHPFAGETLNFELTVVDARAATPEELSHGHAHGPGGHHH